MRIQFRIVRRGPKAVVQSYLDADDPEVMAGYASPGWGALVSGFASVEQAREEFARLYATQDIAWHTPDAGTFAAFDGPEAPTMR